MASSTSSVTGTSSVSGLVSGLDWQSIIDQLRAVEQQPVTLLQNKQSDDQAKLSAWQSFNTQLLALKTAAEALQDPDKFAAYTTQMTTDSSTVQGADLLSVSTGAAAAPGSYSVGVTNLAKAQKLSSNPFSSSTSELGSAYAGDLVINGKVLTVNSTDTLSSLASRINSLNTGSNPTHVTASVLKYGANDYRLVLTSDVTGESGISLLNGSSTDLIQGFGWKDHGTAVIKNAITSGAQSDRVASPTEAIKALLGLSSGESGDLTIGDKTVAIDLSAMSLNDIKDAINAAAPTGVTASVVSQTVNGTTSYRLQIDGTQTFVDADNILNTLGILDHGSSDVTGKVSGNAMTSEGASITAQTLLVAIDGYNAFTSGDYLTLTGTDTSGNDIGTEQFSISTSTTVQDLLDEIKATYGDVLASVTSDGKIRVDDLSGGTSLVVNIADHLQDSHSTLEFVNGDDNFGAASTRKRQIVAGEDAVVEVDGVEVTSSDNTIDDVIPGVTLNLIKEDPATTVTLNVNPDLESIKGSIKDFVDKYNAVMSTINTQSSYDTESQKTGGVLFGDGTLSSVKADLTSILVQTVQGVNSQFSTLGMVGINLDNNLNLSIDDATLTKYLQTNFSDVMALFVGEGTTSGSDLTYVSHTNDTKTGSYTVHIDQAATRATTTGTVDLTGGGADDTLTITQGDNVATITITGGMTLADIKNSINAELDTVHTQTVVGSQMLKEDDGVTAITSQTAWDNISGAALDNGDVISFSGTSRNGSSVSGTYTIGEVSTDTVQGLLSAIESAFGNQVTAAIDSSGRILVKDNSSGTSQVSLDLTEPDGKGVDFGSVLTTNSGGEQGRYAMGITATDDGSGHLVIRNDDYGPTSFTIAQETAELGLIDSTYTGQSVSGTINGEAATGAGQVLTGAAGNPTTAGLSVKYTGTANDVDAGMVSVTTGVAELFARTLFNITDPYEGYLCFKQNSIQDDIKSLNDQIAEMNARIDQKMQVMTSRFLAMETAISKFSSLSSWLTSQLQNLNNNWSFQKVSG